MADAGAVDYHNRVRRTLPTVVSERILSLEVVAMSRFRLAKPFLV